MCIIIGIYKNFKLSEFTRVALNGILYTIRELKDFAIPKIENYLTLITYTFTTVIQNTPSTPAKLLSLFKDQSIKIAHIIIVVGIVIIVICFRITNVPIIQMPKGLENVDDTCYMNAIMQAASTVDITYPSSLKCKPLENFCALIECLNNPYSDVKENTKKLQDLAQSVDWKKPAQQDSFDFLSALMTKIQRNIKASPSDSTFILPMKIKLIHRFFNMGIPDKIQDHLGLSIGLCGDYSVRPGETLEYLVKANFDPTIIDDDPNKRTQLFFYKESPNTLLLHIQANKWDNERGEMTKPEYYIQYDKEMTLLLDIVPEVGKDLIRETVTYDLKAVVRHFGNISGGHYVTYREYKGKWVLFNDEQVEEIPFDKTIVPYVLIYQKRVSNDPLSYHQLNPFDPRVHARMTLDTLIRYLIHRGSSLLDILRQQFECLIGLLNWLYNFEYD